MGGEAFSGLTTTIRKEEVAQTLNALLINVLKPVGIDSYVPLGSVVLDSNGKSWKKTDSGFRGGHWKMPHNDLWIDTVDMKRIGFVFIKGGI